jgi:hypothetical protein
MFLVEPGLLQLGQNLGSCQLLFNLTIIIIILLHIITRAEDFSLSKSAEEKVGIFRRIIRLTC